MVRFRKKDLNLVLKIILPQTLPDLFFSSLSYEKKILILLENITYKAHWP